MQLLEKALQFRKSLPEFRRVNTFRLFHGPTEGTDALSDLTIDVFADFAWFTWRKTPPPTEILNWLKGLGIQSACGVVRESGGPKSDPQVLLGNPPPQLEVFEFDRKFLIRPKGHLHPGLFLDQLPLRNWLQTHAQGRSVLNTFSYTGSLSIAAALGGAGETVSVDLSRTFTDWAKQNAESNGLQGPAMDYLYGDTFEWLPRFKKRGRFFDLVITDPPSFSRGKKGVFSTEKDLIDLVSLHSALVKPGGHLVVSINTAEISWKRFRDQIQQALSGRIQKEAEHFRLPPFFAGSQIPEPLNYLKVMIVELR